MLIPIRFTYKKMVTAIVLTHLFAFHECRRNPCMEEGAEVTFPQKEISYQAVEQRSHVIQQIIYQDDYTSSSQEEPAGMPTAGTVASLVDGDEAALPAFQQGPVGEDGGNRLPNDPSESFSDRREASMTMAALQNTSNTKRSAPEQDTNSGLDNSLGESIATQPQAAAAPTTLATEPNKPTIIITEKMVRNLPDGPLKIALVQLKKKQELEKEGNRGILPINLRQIGAKGMGPIHGAVNAGDPDLVHLMLQGGDNVNRLGPANNTPLHMAVINGDEAIVRILLNTYKADKQLKNKDGKTPAQIAEEMFGSSSPLYALLK